MTGTISDLRDLSLGVVAILAMAWIIAQLIKWQLEANKTWTGKVEEWGQAQRDDKNTIIGVVKDAATVIQQFQDANNVTLKERERVEGVMTDAVRDICAGLQKNTDCLATVMHEVQEHRVATEQGRHGKAN
jgi:hypothetical protein